MKFVSYAQNFEDVMLWRALRRVEHGFYIDIGAQDPIVDSVSLSFYEHGWRGVHVEPTTQYANKLRAARPDETVLQAAIGTANGPLTFYEFKDTGLSTADPIIARQHREKGFVCSETRTPVISLDELLDQISTHTVHWLKLDVEGLERSVLESWRKSVVRPWILVIESTLPLTQAPSHAEWEHLILAKGYQFAYFDGLNRYYVSSENAPLLRAFSTPVNIFDDFELSGTASQPFCDRVARKLQLQEARAAQQEQRANEAEARAEQQEQRANVAEARALSVETQLASLLSSRSWRITAPLRKLMSFLKSGRRS